MRMNTRDFRPKIVAQRVGGAVGNGVKGKILGKAEWSGVRNSRGGMGLKQWEECLILRQRRGKEWVWTYFDYSLVAIRKADAFGPH